MVFIPRLPDGRVMPGPRGDPNPPTRPNDPSYGANEIRTKK